MAGRAIRARAAKVKKVSCMISCLLRYGVSLFSESKDDRCLYEKVKEVEC